MSRHSTRRSPLQFAYDHPEIVLAVLLVATLIGSVMTR